MNALEVRARFEEGFAELRERLRELDPFDLPSVPVERTTRDLPNVSCVYFVLVPASHPEILYIGKAANLRARWSPNWQNGYHACHLPALKRGFCQLAWWELGRVLTDIAERLLIDLHRPPWNLQGNPDGSGVPWISVEDLVSLGVEPTLHEFHDLAQSHIHEILSFTGKDREVTYEDFRRWIDWVRTRTSRESGGTVSSSSSDAGGAAGNAA